MIPRDFITEWRERAPWVTDRQVEQDLVIARALVELFSREPIAKGFAFRGGTALYKLHFRPARYSEDIDLVQVAPGDIGPLLEEIRAALEGWLGKAQWKQSQGRVTLSHRFDSEELPAGRLKLKIEINTREHFTALGLKRHPFAVDSRWFKGSTEVSTYQLDELLGTKLRALYQRKKGRDLFDLAHALKSDAVTPAKVVEAFQRYMTHENATLSRAMFEKNLIEKRQDAVFRGDMAPLLATGEAWSLDGAFDTVMKDLIALLPGAPWKGA